LPGLFLLCSRPWLLTTAAEGGLEPVPADRFRGAYPHQLSSYALLSLSAFRTRGAQLSAILKLIPACEGASTDGLLVTR